MKHRANVAPTGRRRRVSSRGAMLLVTGLLVLSSFSAGCRSAGPEAGTGDVAFRLLWEGKSDLDLHVRDPAGEHIFYGHRRAYSGGHLDVDCNSGTGRTCERPIENVFWAERTAPAGRYLVWVEAHAVYPAEAPVELALLVLDGERVVARREAALSENGERLGPFELAYPPADGRTWRLERAEAADVGEGRSLPFICADDTRFVIRFQEEGVTLIYRGESIPLVQIGDEMVAEGGRTVLRDGPTPESGSVLATPEATHRECRPDLPDLPEVD